MRTAFLLVVASAVIACSSNGAPSGVSSAPGPLATQFETSARANGVPRDLMIAIAQTEGALDIPRTRDVAPEVAVPAAGPLQLRHGKLDTLARGAALMNTTELALRRDSDLALEAAARVLAEVGARTSASGDLTTWEAALEEMSGYADDAHRQDYAHRVFALLARGGTFDGRDGEKITIDRHDIPPAYWMQIDTGVHTLAGAEFPGAEWFPTSCTNKCDFGRAGIAISEIVIHDTEGSWDASVATLQNDPGKSVQYIVNTDGKVGQFVHEADTAWHAGNYYVNQRSVGIEHVGYYNKPYPEAQYASSAKLVSYLTSKYGVKKDRAHIIGHDQVPNGNVLGESAAPCSASPKTCETGSSYGGADNHRDPGDWEWATYMPRIGASAKCDDVTNLLNCSHDLTQAFRCTNGKVEVLQCTAGCVVKPIGVDDQCNVKPQGSSSSSSSSSSSGGGDGAGPGPLPSGSLSSSGDGTPAPPPPTTDPSTSTDPPSVSTGGGHGCNAAGTTNGGASGLLLALGAAALVRRRRRA